MWKDVDWKQGTITAQGTRVKNKESKVFPFAEFPELRALLEAQRADTDRVQRERGAVIPWVFHFADGRPIKQVRRSWRTACEAAGLPDRQRHDFRRTSARRMDEAGVRRTVAMKLGGWKTEDLPALCVRRQGRPLQRCREDRGAHGDQTGWLRNG